MTQELKEQDDPRMFGSSSFRRIPYADENWRNFYENASRATRAPRLGEQDDMDEAGLDP